MWTRILLSVSMLLLEICLLGLTAPVTNLNTGETFNSIQAAIDDSDTLDGHIIEINSAEYDSANEPGAGPWGDGEAMIIISKPVTVQSTGGAGQTLLDARGNYIVVVGIITSNVVLDGFQVQNAAAPTGSEQMRRIGGIVVDHVSNVKIHDNIVNSCQGFGIELSGAVNCEVSNNDVSNTTVGSSWVQGVGISVTADSTGATIAENSSTFNERHGIDTSDARSDQITENTCSNNGQVGINIYTGTDELIQGNTVADNGEGGIDLNYTVGCEVKENTVEGNWFYGVRLAPNCKNNVIDNNEVYNTYSSGDSWVSGVGISSTGGGCGELNENNTFSNNYVHDNAFGIIVNEASSCDIIGNTVENNDAADFTISAVMACSDTEWWYLTADISNGGGIHVNGPDNTITGNTVTGNGFGIMVHGGDGAYASIGNDVSNNTVSNNRQCVHIPEQIRMDRINCFHYLHRTNSSKCLPSSARSFV